MVEALKLRGVHAIRRRLKDGSEKIYYRHRQSGVNLGNSDDVAAVLRKYARVAQEQPGPKVPSREPKRLGLRPRLVSEQVAAAYCSLSVPEFNKFVRPQVHPHIFGETVRFDLQEIDNLFDLLSDIPGFMASSRNG